MEWTTNANPENTGPYLASIKIEDKYFNYVSWYNSETRVWHKRDPFADEENEILGPIEGSVIAWSNPPANLDPAEMV